MLSDSAVIRLQQTYISANLQGCNLLSTVLLTLLQSTFALPTLLDSPRHPPRIPPSKPARLARLIYHSESIAPLPPILSIIYLLLRNDPGEWMSRKRYEVTPPTDPCQGFNRFDRNKLGAAQLRTALVFDLGEFPIPRGCLTQGVGSLMFANAGTDGRTIGGHFP